MFFVLPGFKGTTPNKFTRAFERYFPQETVVGLNYDFDPDLAASSLIIDVRKHNPGSNTTFVGHSLGGFWALYLAKLFGCKAVLIAPFVNPWTRVDGAGKYYTFRGKRISITAEQIAGYAKYGMLDTFFPPTLVLLERADKKILTVPTIEILKQKTDLIFVFPGGSHRFNHVRGACPIIEWFYYRQVLSH